MIIAEKKYYVIAKPFSMGGKVEDVQYLQIPLPTRDVIRFDFGLFRAKKFGDLHVAEPVANRVGGVVLLIREATESIKLISNQPQGANSQQ